MKMIKIKAKIYQYTGLYLAKKEELRYLKSKKFWSEFDRMQKYNKKNQMTNRDLQSLLLGTWQYKKGFSRFMSEVKLKYGLTIPWYMRVVVFFELLIKHLKNDLLK